MVKILRFKRFSNRTNRGLLVNIVNSWPESFVGTAVKLWAYNFMNEVYHSGYPIKQVGVTVNSTKSIGKYFRAFLGVNQVKT